MVQHVEAEIHEKDLQRDHHAVEDARQDAGLEVLLEGPAVGGPPVARFVPQGPQHGVVHPGQHGACQNAAHCRREQHHGQAVHQKADVHQADDGHKAQAGEQVCQKHPAHIPAYQLKKAAEAGLAGGVLLDAVSGFEIVCRRK